MSGNVQPLREVTISSWSGADVAYQVAEADACGDTVFLGIKLEGDVWYWEVVDKNEAPFRTGTAESEAAAKALAEAAAGHILWTWPHYG